MKYALVDVRRFVCAMAGVLVFAGVVVTAAPAAEQVEEGPDEDCPICDLKDKANSAIPGVKFGADLRLRLIYDNDLMLDKNAPGHERLWSRYRGRVWTQITPFDDFDINVRLVTEPRVFTKPDILEEQTIRQEALFDKMNIKWSGILGTPLTVKAGRQDLKFGDGWLIIEGTPRDGTRSFFFDAIRATWDAQTIETTFDLVVLRNHTNSSWFIRPFNDRDVTLIEHDETGVIVYASNQSLANTTVDGYFIYKHDDRVLPQGDNADIYTFGIRVAGSIQDNWTYRAEVAPQWGQKNGTDICALGADSELKYHLRDKLQNYLSAGYEFRSGDSDNQDGAFDILWGRFPHWGNIFNDYLSVLETQVSQPSNYHRLSLGWGCKPSDKISLDAAYHLLFANHNTFAHTPGFSNDGKFRGQLLTALLKYEFNEHVSGHLIGETFYPGNYYDGSRNDPAVWVRYQLVFSW